jgi:hypothetical protein
MEPLSYVNVEHLLRVGHTGIERIHAQQADDEGEGKKQESNGRNYFEETIIAGC